MSIRDDSYRARERLDQIHDALEVAGCRPVSRPNGDIAALCPLHDDKDKSLTVKLGEKDGYIVLKCGAGCSTEEILDELELSYSVLMPSRRNRGQFSSENAEEMGSRGGRQKAENAETVKEQVSTARDMLSWSKAVGRGVTPEGSEPIHHAYSSPDKAVRRLSSRARSLSDKMDLSLLVTSLKDHKRAMQAESESTEKVRKHLENYYKGYLKTLSEEKQKLISQLDAVIAELEDRDHEIKEFLVPELVAAIRREMDLEKRIPS